MLIFHLFEAMLDEKARKKFLISGPKRSRKMERKVKLYHLLKKSLSLRGGFFLETLVV